MADQPKTPGPRGLPERQSRARGQLGAPAEATAPVRPAAPSAPNAGAPAGGPGGRPDGAAGALDLDRLRASAASAISAEQASRASGAGSAGSPTRSRTGATAERSATPTWLKVAAPIGVVLALATAGLTLAGGDDDTVTTAGADRSTTSIGPDTTAAPTTDAPTTAAPTTAAPTTATTAAPETVPPTTAPPAAPEVPHHKATYRGGKLYLEGSITSQEEAQKYIDKAAAVLGADNVVNNYVIDPSVPLSTDGTVYVDEPFLFETGSSDLNPEYTGVLGLGVAALKLNPNARMVVTGYTDNKGDPARNQELSLERANSVVDYMVTTGGIDRSRFDAVGAGDRNPVGDNNTEEGRKQNRRIDVKLVNLLG